MKANCAGLRTASRVWFSGVLLCLGISANAAEEPLADEMPNDKSTVENVTHQATDAQWIWTAAHERNEVPVGEVFFRKSFEIAAPEIAEIQITADNRFELFVNGQPVGSGNDWRKVQVFDLAELLTPGRNSIAVQVTNTDEGSAGLVARVLVKEQSGTYRSFSTDASWKTSVRRYQSWTSAAFPDREWVNATSYGRLGNTLPWGDEVVLAGEGSRFNIPENFTIERLMRDEEVGSLIAMAFDAAGNILASVEGGNLLLLSDSDDNGTHDTVGMFCDKIKNVQGILALGARVFAVGDGPQGVCLYRLRDGDRDGMAEEITPLVPIRGSRGEHGAHAIRLGPDGMLYVIIGDHARLGVQSDSRSPYRNWYEGDLVKPRIEDPRGHAVGIPAPGGTIFRTDTEGKNVELLAGGLRNSYDFAFNEEGEIFTYDSDMEWDRGAPWYRPTRVNHVTPGAELGWRSGWAKWPTYYIDSLPPAINIGPGSPTGMEFYNHTAFPEKYRGTMFGCDWGTGRIHCIRFQREGASFTAQQDIFIQGRPLNATDIAVGPDGALYFCTGGRGTDGGVYRVRWEGEPTSPAQPSRGIERALAQPQLDADWARARVAGIMQQMGEAWGKELLAIVQNPERPLEQRRRAVDLLVTFGPTPSEQQLLSLSEDVEFELRAQAARRLYAYATTASRDRLVSLLADEHPLVRRIACESLARMGAPVEPAPLIELLDDGDRFVAFAARRALEQQPLEKWVNLALDEESPQVFCHGAVALLAAERTENAARYVLQRCRKWLAQVNPSEENSHLVDLLRVAQLALLHGQLTASQVPELGPLLVENYPCGIPAADREFVRLLVYLQVPEAAEKFAAEIESDIHPMEKLHVGAYAARLESGWTTETKLTLLNLYEEARAIEGGYSVSEYIESFARGFFAKLSLRERQAILAQGERWPSSALSVIAGLPEEPGNEILDELVRLDRKIAPLCEKSNDFRRLRVGVLAVLGRSGEASTQKYLHGVYQNEPEQRHTVAMALTQNPGGKNWEYLVDSLNTLGGTVGVEVLKSLTKVPERPRQPEAFRQVILLGLRLGDEGAQHALEVLSHWSGQSAPANQSDWQTQLAAWQSWYAEHFPDAPPPELPTDTGQSKWSYEELLNYLDGTAMNKADTERGRQAFETAQCARCHRCNGFGETIGPDLSTVANRFQKKEILEAIVYPSHNVSDQYAGKIVHSAGRTYTGLVVPRGDQGIVILTTKGEKIQLAKDEIDQIQPNPQSPMPAGLLNQLSLQQVADLFAYLEAAGEQNIATQKAPLKR